MLSCAFNALRNLTLTRTFVEVTGINHSDRWGCNMIDFETRDGKKSNLGEYIFPADTKVGDTLVQYTNGSIHYGFAKPGFLDYALGK